MADVRPDYEALYTSFDPAALEADFSGLQTKAVVTDAANRPKLIDGANQPVIVTLGAA